MDGGPDGVEPASVSLDGAVCVLVCVRPVSVLPTSVVGVSCVGILVGAGECRVVMFMSDV
jgi:hypothetical protein